MSEQNNFATLILLFHICYQKIQGWIFKFNNLLKIPPVRFWTWHEISFLEKMGNEAT